MEYSLEFSQIVRRKLKRLKKYLIKTYNADFASKIINHIISTAENLISNPDMGVALSSLYDVDTDFRLLFVNHQYLFYYKDGDKIIVAEMLDEREDFMFKLFGLSGRSQESIDYWGE